MTIGPEIRTGFLSITCVILRRTRPLVLGLFINFQKLFVLNYDRILGLLLPLYGVRSCGINIAISFVLLWQRGMVLHIYGGK